MESSGQARSGRRPHSVAYTFSGPRQPSAAVSAMNPATPAQIPRYTDTSVSSRRSRGRPRFAATAAAAAPTNSAAALDQ